jgi:hypothetical protein
MYPALDRDREKWGTEQLMLESGNKRNHVSFTMRNFSLRNGVSFRTL